MEGKNIKVYGTLINWTLENADPSMRDSQHNDLIAVAYQLFDERFNPKKGSGANDAVTNIDRYQDIINKRLTAIDYDPNGDITNLYSNLYVDGDTNIGGDLTVEGDSTFEGDVNIEGDITITGDANLNIGLNDLNDVTLSTMAIGLVLRYDGSEWVNAKLSLSDLLMPAGAEGKVLKYINGSWVAGDDNDTQLPEGSEGKVLKYINGLWVAADDLTGDALPEGSEGKVLKYINGSWIAGDDNDTKQLSALTDVDIPNVAVGDVLKYNGTKWVAAGDNVGATKLSELSDVNNSVNSATDGQVLKFDASLNKWVAGEASGSGSTNISLEDLDNLNLDSAQDNDTIVYDSTARVWKPSRFGTSNNVTYRTATVTYTKVAKHTFTTLGPFYNSSTQMSNVLFPGQNDVYVYQLQSVPTLASGEHVAYIEPSQSFNSINWSVATYSTDLPHYRLEETSSFADWNCENTVNGTLLKINELGSSEYLTDSQYSSATKTNTSLKLIGLKPINDKGRIHNLLSSGNIYTIAYPSDINGNYIVSTRVIDLISTMNSRGLSEASFNTIENGKFTRYYYIDSVESPWTTHFCKSVESFSGAGQKRYITTTSIDQNTFLSVAGISGTSSPITVDGAKLPFFFVASKDVTYPDTFEATVIIEQSVLGMSYIGGLSINTVDVSTTIIDGSYYAVLNMSSADAAKVVNMLCFYTDNGYVGNPIYALQTSIIAVKYDQSNQRWISVTALMGDCTCRFTYMSVK